MLRKVLRVVVFLGLLGFVFGLGLGFWLKKQVDDGVVEREAARLLEGAAGLTAKFGAIRFGTPGTFGIDVLEIKGPKGRDDFSLAFDLLELDYSLRDLLRLRVKISGLRIVRPRIRAVLTARSLPKAPPRDQKRAPLDLRFLEKELLARLSIERGEVVVEDRLEKVPITFAVRELNLDVAFPQNGSPIRFDVRLAPMGGRVTARGTYDLARNAGDANVAIALPDLSFISPRIASRIGGLKLEKLGIALSGDVIRDGDRLEYGLAGKLDPVRVMLPPPLSTGIGGALAISVKPREIKLEQLTLAVDGLAPLELAATVDGFRALPELADPALRAQATVQADLKLVGLTVASLLPLVPAAKIPPQLNLASDGAVSVTASVRGRLARPDLTAAVEVKGLKGEVRLPKASGPFAVNALKVALDPARIALEELSVSALGVELGARASVREWRTAPQLAAELTTLKVDVAALLAHIADVPPKVKELAPAGMLTLSAKAGANLERWLALNDFKWPQDARKAADKAKGDVQKLRTMPPDKLKPAFEALMSALAATASAKLALAGGRVQVKQVPGGVVEADLVLEADPAGVRVGPVLAGLPQLKAGLTARLDDPLGARKVEVKLAVPASTAATATPPWVELAELVKLIPARPDAPKLPPIFGQLRIAVAVKGSLAGGQLPEPAAHIELRDVHVRVPVEKRELAVALPALSVHLTDRAIEVPEAQVKLPFLALALSARAGPVGPERGQPLTLEALKAIRPEAIPIVAHVGTVAGQALDIAKAVALVPAQRVPQLAKLKPQGQVTLSADVQGTVGAPKVRAQVDAGTGGLAVAVRARSDDLKARHVDASVDLKFERIVQTVKAIAPELALGPVENLPPASEVKLAAHLTGKAPGGYKVDATLEALEAKVALAGTLDDLVRPGEASVEGTWTLASLDKIKPLLPARAQEKLDEAQPQFRAGGPLKFTRRGPRSDVVAGLELADVRAAWQGFTGPVKLQVGHLRIAAAASVVKGAPAPFSGQAEVKGSGGRVTIKGKTIPVDIVPSRIAFTPDRVSTDKLHLKLVDQDILVKGELARDLAKAVRVDVTVDIPALDPGHVLRQVGPQDDDLAVAGSIGLNVTARGPIAHPDLIDVGAQLTIPSLSVKHPALKGLPLKMTNGKVQVTRDDVVIPAADTWKITLGSQHFSFPVAGSIKELGGVPNLFKVTDPKDLKKMGERIVTRIGGEKKIAVLLGEDQMLRLIGDKLYKVKVHIKVKDRPDFWEFKGAMAPEDTKLFRERTHEIVEKYTRMAKQKLAETMGFRKAVHGEENYKLLRIEKVGLIVLDQGFNMVYPREIPFWRLTVTPSEW